MFPARRVTTRLQEPGFAGRMAYRGVVRAAQLRYTRAAHIPGAESFRSLQ